MRVAKNFGWESAHRLLSHAGLCKNLHGHSYRMTVIMQGEPDGDGIVIDFQDIKRLLKPLVDSWDHATLISKSDTDLIDVIEGLGDRYVVLPFETTAENLCRYVADHLLREGSKVVAARGITQITVRIHETDSCFAEHTVDVA
ncbi:MAG: 6-carboxytetrahydropterin synthase [Rhodothermales bacterium]|nr:6-carboxytetrahydropterin synthase [Rhodothermales bacterium]